MGRRKRVIFQQKVEQILKNSFYRNEIPAYKQFLFLTSSNEYSEKSYYWQMSL